MVCKLFVLKGNWILDFSNLRVWWFNFEYEYLNKGFNVVLIFLYIMFLELMLLIIIKVIIIVD